MSVSIYQLYELFFKSDLVNIRIPLTSENKVYPKREIYQSSIKSKKYTPITEKLLEFATTGEKEKLLKDLEEDDKQIGLLSRKELLDDPDFIDKLNYSALGFYMETYLCYHGVCPLCKQKTLKKFKDCSIPAIDFICVNPYHYLNNECFLYQLKTSVDSDYFDAMHIKVGSRRFGNLSHSIKGSSHSDLKKLLIGYICLKLNPTGDNKYSLNKKSSFCIIPNLKLEKDELYYQYIKDDVIQINLSMMNSIKVEEFFNIAIVDNMTFVEDPFTNPYFTLYDLLPMNDEKRKYDELRIGKNLSKAMLEVKGGYYYKYMKYKAKYIKLKAKII